MHVFAYAELHGSRSVLIQRRAFCSLLAGAALGAKRRPNVLFLAVDDLRPELGIYGARHVHSPHIDALGQRGVVFSRAYCQQALCNPSRASILTGQRPDKLRVWDLDTDFRRTRPHAVTLPQHAKAHGYYTLSSGKIFHNSFPDPPSWSEPELRIPGYPFDPDAVYRSESEVRALEARKRTILAEGRQKNFIDRYGEWYLKNNASEAPNVADNAYFDGAQTDAAVDRLAQLAQRREPFFFGVGFYRPHLPFNVPGRYWDLYQRDKIPLPPNPFLPSGAPHMAENRNRELRGYRDFAQAPTPDQGTLSEAETRRLRHGYLASVSYIDAQVGRLTAALDRLRLRENTIVVLWSDHGWKLGEHNAWGKMTNYEIDTRVPLLFAGPGVRRGRAEGLVELLDVYPTLCAMMGLPSPEDLDGRSLAPQLRDAKAPGKAAAFSQYLRNGIWSAKDGVPYMGYAMRTDRYRYVEWYPWQQRERVARELYDLRTDPQENVNLAGNIAQLPDEVQKQWQQAPFLTLPR